MLPINISLLSVYFIGAYLILTFGFIRIDYLLKVTLYDMFLYKILWWPRMILMTKYHVDYYWKIFC